MKRPVLLALSLLSCSCGSAVLDAADAGDVDVFRARLDERLNRGEVSIGEAKDIAERFLRRQIEGARGPNGERSLAAISRCGATFDGALEKRARTSDELGARAALLRAELGRLAPLAFSDRRKSSEPHWRAVAARTLTIAGPEAHITSSDAARRREASEWRRKMTLDPSAVVRRAALAASRDAADVGDVRAVLEAGRLDPDPDARLVAIDAAGAIGTREAVLGLADLWPSGEEKVRVAVVGAWAAAWRKPFIRGDSVSCIGEPHHGSCEAYGQLARASERNEGWPSVLAALELVHGVSPALSNGSVSADAVRFAEASAAAVLERAIDEGPVRVRTEAIRSAPLALAQLLEAVVEAAGSTDDRVAVVALGRLLELGGKERDKALGRLRKIAAGDDDAAAEARRALVEAGDPRAAKLLERDAKAASALSRGDAASGYAALGRMAAALKLLADRDPSVRVLAGCAILEAKD